MTITTVGRSGLICGMAMLLGSAPARATAPLNSVVHIGVPAVAVSVFADTFQPSVFLPEYSVFTPSEAAVRQLHDVLVQAMVDGGFQPGGPQPADGQGAEIWTQRELNQTVVSVRWSSEAGYVQLTFRQSGRPTTGEGSGQGSPVEPLSRATLERALTAFNVVADPADTTDGTLGEARYQRKHQDLEADLLARGFRLIWIRENMEAAERSTVMAWYHPGLDVTVLCMTRPDGTGHVQTVVPLTGRLRSTFYFPE
jgi:hypothetical protein